VPWQTEGQPRIFGRSLTFRNAGRAALQPLVAAARDIRRSDAGLRAIFAYSLPARYLVGVPGIAMPLRFPSFSLGTRDVRLADVFRILKQGLDSFLYNASIFG
jgi:hypothetical protein